MARRGIPRRTMADVSRARIDKEVWGHSARPSGPNRRAAEGTPVAPVNAPREWRYQTRPFFKRVRGPLLDVFNEAREVLIVVDLGGFTRGEISLVMTPQQYTVRAARGDQRFSETIELPPNVDIARSQERFVNGVLEIVLPVNDAAAARTKGRARCTGRK